jgi:hypothetical protein
MLDPGQREADMRLELTDDEAEVLRDLLSRVLGDLSMEISHTDNPSYRQLVRSHRDALRRLHDALLAGGGDEPATGTGG